jgi:restriction endonuclease S subunit
MLIHDIPIEKIRKRDSLDIMNIGETFGKYNIICANPPFGAGDQVNIYDDKYWGPLKTGKKVIKDAMAQFIMHMYQSLLPGGRCGTVSDRGIINNGTDSKNAWQTKLRKFLLENTNLYRIVLLPKETFEYTTFATCILFFNKDTNGTSSVEYRELSIKEVIIDGQKTKTINEDKILGTITIEQIKSNNYSLKSDDYFKIKEVKQDMDQWINLGDVCEFQKGKSFNTSNMIKGQYKVIGGGFIPMKEYTHNEYNTEENEILISNDGAYAGYLNKFNEKIFITGHCNKIVHKNNINKYFLWYYLKINQSNIINNYQKGQAQPTLYKDKLLNEFMVPNIPLDHQTEIVEFLDKQFEMYQINKLNKQIPLFDLLIKKEWNIATELIHLVYRQMATVEELANIKRDIKGIFGLSVYGLGNKCQMMKLGDIVEIKFGTRITKGKDEVEKNTENAYPVYGGGGITFYTDKYNRNGETLLLSRFGVSPNCVRIIKGKLFLNDSGMSIQSKDEKLNFDYLKYFIINKHQYIYNNYTSGNAQQNMETNKLLNEFKIPVPSLEIQEEIINKINKLNEQSSHYDTYAKFIQTELDNITETIQNMTKNQI